MNSLSLSILAVAGFIVAPAALGQIATSNEDGATGAYSAEVDSSFTAEGRFGPRTAIDDLRADVDRERETVEKIRMEQLREPKPAPVKIEPYEAPAQGDPDIDYREDAPVPE